MQDDLIFSGHIGFNINKYFFVKHLRSGRRSVRDSLLCLGAVIGFFHCIVLVSLNLLPGLCFIWQGPCYQPPARDIVVYFFPVLAANILCNTDDSRSRFTLAMKVGMRTTTCSALQKYLTKLPLYIQKYRIAQFNSNYSYVVATS